LHYLDPTHFGYSPHSGSSKPNSLKLTAIKCYCCEF